MFLAELEVKAPVPEKPPPVVVAVPVVRPDEVPQAKPCCVASDPPLPVMFPLRVAEVWVIESTVIYVVTVGATTAAVGVTAFEAELGVLVPTAFTAYTAKV